MPIQVILNQEGSKSANGLGVAAVVLGVLAILICWIPLVNLLAIPLIFLGGLLALVGLMVALANKKSGPGWPITGIGLNAFAFVVMLVVNAVLGAAVATAAKEAAAVEEARVRTAVEPPLAPTPGPALALATASAPAAARPGIEHPGIDEDGILELPGGTAVWMATTDDDWDDLIDAENFGAGGGKGAGGPIYRMAQAGRARVYPNGTRVRVRKTSFTARFVEVVDGDDTGRSGWVQVEFVRRPRSDDATRSPAADPVMEKAKQINDERAEAARLRVVAKADKDARDEAVLAKARAARPISLLAMGKNF
jgi:hypothetical protein